MFRIKICGVTQSRDVEPIGRAGADAIGLNFVPASRRFIAIDAARAISAIASEQKLARVGVFVNETLERIAEIHREVGLDWIQLHGDEPDEAVNGLKRMLPGVKICRALRWESGFADDIGPIVAHWDASAIDALLVDAFAPDAYGGTGKVVDWSKARELAASLKKPLVLAGGLTPDNVAAAIEAVSPAAVDTASGVELEPGVKSHSQVEAFAAAARAAFANTG
ncbi:MAG: phosphoribosylanthranilate isomerase [Planctomycetales bacterium]|nr:phosphoribosylanthranilate isomerase [Planctomycetales bacterium]